jgi:hypothetical protein
VKFIVSTTVLAARDEVWREEQQHPGWQAILDNCARHLMAKLASK